jgi:hypothetical protein
MSALSYADAEEPIFANIQWGSNSKVVIASLKSVGFSDIEFTPQKDVVFSGGRILGEEAGGLAIFANDKLVSISIRLETADGDAIPVYFKLKKMLSKKYDDPDIDLVNFESPYVWGDGYEQTAIRLGKSDIRCRWGNSLELNVTKKLTVRAVYMSLDLGKEIKRRSAVGKSLF